MSLKHIASRFNASSVITNISLFSLSWYLGWVDQPFWCIVSTSEKNLSPWTSIETDILCLA